DSWFAGFTGDRMGVVWIGRDENGSTGLTGATGALQVWIDIMKNISDTSYDPALPENISLVHVDPSGNLMKGPCPGELQIPFRSEYVPKKLKRCTKRKSILLKWIKEAFK
ncbi:MAG: penicillin-binding protein 1B, partial [Nitrospinota bacterium]